MAKPHTILVIGASGFLGFPISQSVLAQGHKLKILARTNATADRQAKLNTLKERGAEICEGSLDDLDSVKHALEHVDVVISTVNEQDKQLAILPLLKSSPTLKRFIPSEFGISPRSSPEGDVPFFDIKARVQDEALAHGIPSTFIYCGGLIESYINFTELYGDGTVKCYYTSVDDVARVTVKAALDERTKNKAVFFDHNFVTQTELLRAAGKNVEEFPKVSTAALQQRIQEGKAAKKGFELILSQILYYVYVEPNVGPGDAPRVSRLYPSEKIKSVSEAVGKPKV